MKRSTRILSYKRIMTALALMAALCLCMASLCACDNTAEGTENGKTPTTAEKSDGKQIQAVINTERTMYNVLPDSDDFSLDVVTNSDGDIHYRSSNEAVAYVDQGGDVRVGRIGEASINISIPATERFTAATRTVRVKVAKKQKLQLAKKSYRLSYGDAPFQIFAKTNIKSSRKMRFKTNDSNIIMVDADGVASVTGPGRTTITVIAPGTTRYHAATADVAIEVDRKAQKIILDKDTFDVSLVDNIKLKADSDSGGALTYKSSDESILKVSKKGKIEPVALGEATVTVYQKGDKEYKPAKKTVSVTVREPNAEEQRLAAVEWAIQIASDDSFCYGTGSGAHRYGCYFCGTNYGPNKYIKPNAKYLKTYCCNPFVHAAYAHGAQNKAMLRACQKGSGIGLSDDTFTRYGCWENIGKPGFDKLVPGDVFVKKGRHASLYCGGDDEVEAGAGGWGPTSISVKSAARSRYNSCTYVMRYTGE